MSVGLLMAFGVSLAQDATLELRAVAAPIAPGGATAGEPTDIVIFFDTSLDPNVLGRSLPKGGAIRVTLPDAFAPSDPPLPVASVGTEGCSPAEGTCNTAVLLQGWPQNPVRPFTLYPLSLEGTHTLVYTAAEDIPAPTDTGPGIKNLHLLLLGFTNPEPGSYELVVEADTGPDGATERGVARLEILADIPPTISVTSALSESPGTNLDYQAALPGEVTPLPFDFLLWDAGGAPLEGVTVEADPEGGARLMQGERQVGSVEIAAPAGAEGQRVFTEGASGVIASPVSAIPTGHLRVFFEAGSEAGEYRLTFTLDGGNAQEMIVRAGGG